ncbi:hypothetical protein E2C01_040217 [Portunus trituberculatus]|uniref:Uncharacterized protein n=1 Tax=Portunus trituberculatus TaxID=210409 RepID=A0A5B7FMD9_PORTR|nr:hypothetical protein [Portunus trituberculatus]
MHEPRSWTEKTEENLDVEGDTVADSHCCRFTKSPGGRQELKSTHHLADVRYFVDLLVSFGGVGEETLGGIGVLKRKLQRKDEGHD